MASKTKKMASKRQKMAQNTPFDLPVPFSQVDGLKKMASKNSPLPAILSFKATFLIEKREKYMEFCKCKIARGFAHFWLKKWLRESFSQVNPQKHGAIFCNASTCENGTRRSEGMFEAIFCHFDAIFSI
jgi:hypothetical protein